MNNPENRYESDGWFCQYATIELEEIGPPQERAVGRCVSAEHDVVAAAGSGVAAVEHEFFALSRLRCASS